MESGQIPDAGMDRACFFDVATLLPIRIAVCSLWLLAVGGGFVVISNYQNTSGGVGNTPHHWPSGSRILLNYNHDTLLMFAHPQCPCTRASVAELNRLLARSNKKMDTQVWFFKPTALPNDWTHGDLWRSAAAIPGVTVHEDLEGAQARLFGAETSGYVLLYDTHGKLLFKGGITGGRGHAGDNAGEDAVVSQLAGADVKLKQTQVYGCSLLGRCKASLVNVSK